MSRMLSVAVVAWLAAGCGPSLPVKPKTFPVHGTVSLQGSPVHGGDVEFEPVAGSVGALDGRSPLTKDGEFKASSYVDQDGMVPGEYKVRVIPYVGLPGKLGVEPTAIPAKYQSFETSELKCTVKAEDNAVDLKLQ